MRCSNPICHFFPVLLAGAKILRVDAASRFGEADRMRRPQGDLDAVAGSWTIERKEDGYVQHRPP